MTFKVLAGGARSTSVTSRGADARPGLRRSKPPQDLEIAQNGLGRIRAHGRGEENRSSKTSERRFPVRPGTSLLQERPEPQESAAKSGVDVLLPLQTATANVASGQVSGPCLATQTYRRGLHPLRSLDVEVPPAASAHQTDVPFGN